MQVSMELQARWENHFAFAGKVPHPFTRLFFSTGLVMQRCRKLTNKPRHTLPNPAAFRRYG